VRRICAWCGTDLGVKTPWDNGTDEILAPGNGAEDPGNTPSHDPGVVSTICGDCAARLRAYRNPVLVVSREWARLYDELVEMMRGRPDIQVILDRRQPTGGGDGKDGWNGPERRRTDQPLALK
jgi:hypothetical protein